MLSFKRYGWLSVLGGEVAYLICFSVVTCRCARRGTEIHHACSRRCLDLLGVVHGA
jgi:hypothetical protein